MEHDSVPLPTALQSWAGPSLPASPARRHTDEETKANIRDLETRAWKILPRTPVLVQETQAQGLHDDDDTNAADTTPHDRQKQLETKEILGSSHLEAGPHGT